MRSVGLLALTVAASGRATAAFTRPSTSAPPLTLGSFFHYRGCDRPPPILHAARQCDGVEGTAPSLIFAKEVSTRHHGTPTTLRRIRKACTVVRKRMDTMSAADLHVDGLVPMQSGFKMNLGLIVGAFLFKWYRARFITKIPVWDRQPQWNMVVTSPEQEKELHAYSCKQCGATIFIARHREWFFKGGNTECTNCGAKGKENFVDIRGEVLDSIDDDYFDYESPLDFVSAAERRKLVKQAGGDEDLAKKIAIQNAMKNDKEQIQVEEDGELSGSSESGKDAAEPRGKANKNVPVKGNKKESVDIFEELDMDL